MGMKHHALEERNFERKRPPGRPKHRWGNSMKMEIKNWINFVDCIKLAYVKVSW